MKDREKGEKHRYVSVSVKEGHQPLPSCAREGGVGLFQKESQAWPGPQELTSPPTLHFSRELPKPKPAEDRIMCSGVDHREGQQGSRVAGLGVQGVEGCREWRRQGSEKGRQGPSPAHLLSSLKEQAKG